MPTAFMTGFATAICARLIADHRLELAPGADPAEVAAFVAEALTRRSQFAGLVTSLSAALIACPAVEELFADDAELQQLVNDLGSP